MTVHKLVLDDIYEDVSSTLIAIHSSIEDYRMAFLLNRYLEISLARKTKDLYFNNGSTRYSVFEFEDPKNLVMWNLVSNVCSVETDSKIDPQSLFSMRHKIIRNHHLIPEYKKVNYFLKIESEFNNSKGSYIINTILKIQQIAMAYNVDISTLKSKEHLIFD